MLLANVLGVVKSLFDRAKIICKNENLNMETEVIKSTLLKNNYPKEFLDKCFKEFSNPRPKDNTKLFTTNLIIPYIQGFSDKIKRISQKFNIRTIFKTNNTLRSLLTKTKPLNENEVNKNVIYKIPCHCGKFYIGETCRSLPKRIKEHQKYIKQNEFHKSKLTQHAFDNNHRINWNDSTILAKEPISKLRKLKESAFITLNKDECIASCSIDFHNTWISILQKEVDRGILKIK